MKIKLIFIIISFFLYAIAYSQYPIGKNIKIAEKEIKQLLKSKGFTFLKVNEEDKDLKILEYSDEFTVVLGINYYENVTYINISAMKSKVFEKLKAAFAFSKWTYIGQVPNINNENEALYYYNSYKIRVPDPGVRYQFIINLIEEN